MTKLTIARARLATVVFLWFTLHALPGGATVANTPAFQDDQTQTKPATKDPSAAGEAPATQSAPASRAARPRGGARRPERPSNAAPIAIEHVRVVRPGRPDLEDVTVLVRGRRIASVGRKVEIPQNARRIDGTGATLTAGFIDARGATPLGPESLNDGTLSGAHKAIDGIDYLDREGRVRAAVQSGITACYISAGIAPVSGEGVLVHLRPGERDLEKLEVDGTAAISMVMGAVRGEPVVARLTQVTNLRRAMREAQKYREALDQYQEDLQKFLEDKKKGLKPVAKAVEEAAAPADTPARPPIPIPRNRRPPRDAAEAEYLQIARVLHVVPVVEGRDGSFVLDDTVSDVTEMEQIVCNCGIGNHDHHPPGGGEFVYLYQDPGGAPKPDAKAAERPKKPDFNPSMEALVAALRRETTVRIEARRADEIRAALALANEFKLRAIIEGLDEAHLLVPELVASKIPLILAPLSSSDSSRELGAALGVAAELEKRGATFAIASGREFYGTAWLRARLAHARAAGLSRDGALAAVTTAAAEILGISTDFGSVEPGRTADLVLFDGDPLEPATRVKMSLIEGEVVFER